MISRAELQKKEDENLQQAKHAYPDKFISQQVIDDADRLKTIGIEIQGKEQMPNGYVKLWPEDFIVEEIDQHGNISTISFEENINNTEVDGSQFHCTLVKCGITTQDAIRDIAKLLNCRTNQIGYAGIKDKNAITAQRISIRGVAYDKIAKISSTYFFIKNIQPNKQPIQAGQLQGNRFSLVIRTNTPAHDYNNLLKEKLTTIKTSGFPNFFYTQRFGSMRLASHTWGKLLLQGNYEEAAKQFLTTPYTEGAKFFLDLREQVGRSFPNWNEIQEILSSYPVFFSNELIFVEHMQRNPNDYIGGLQKISDQVKLWVYAYASFAFNKKLSEALRSNAPIPSELENLYDTNTPIYKSFLETEGIYPLDTSNLEVFKELSVKNQSTTKTFSSADILEAKTTRNAILLQFTLDKGSYATTLLANIINIVSGPPTNFDTTRIDIQKTLEGADNSKTFAYFSEIIGTEEDRIDLLSR